MPNLLPQLRRSPSPPPPPRLRHATSEVENRHNLADNRLLENVMEEENKMMNSVEPTSNCFDSNERLESGEGVESQELAGGFHNDPFICNDDAVLCEKDEGLLGVVIEIAGDAYSESSILDDSGGDEYGERTGDNSTVGGDGGSGHVNTDGVDISDFLLDGQVRIRWIDGSETAENINDMTVVDRRFYHGDIVACSSDPSGQLGLVLDVNIMVDLQAADGEVIKHVSSKDLKRTRELRVGDYVVLGSWLGEVHDVFDTVTVSFDCGLFYKFLKADPSRLEPLSGYVADDSPYYPGQRVRIGTSWLSGLWKTNCLEGTVTKVKVESVTVYWKESAYLGLGANLTKPSLEQDVKNLTLLSCYSHVGWKLGDWCHLPSHPVKSSSFSDIQMAACMKVSDKLPCGLGSILGDHQAAKVPYDETSRSSYVTRSVNVLCRQGRNECNEKSTASNDLEEIFQLQSHDSNASDNMNKNSESGAVLRVRGSCSTSPSVSREINRGTLPAYWEKLCEVFFRRHKMPHEASERSFTVINIATKVDVLWQDGTRRNGLESKFLIPIFTPSDHEFFPGAYVLNNASSEVDDPSENRMGVVKSLNSKEHTVLVRWFKSLFKPEGSTELDYDEVVSAYELSRHPDYDYRYGDVVLRLSPVSDSTGAANCETSLQHHANLVKAEANQVRKDSDYVETEQVTKDEVCEDFRRLSWVGNITGSEDGDLEVKWADGTTSKVGPHTIYNVSAESFGEEPDKGSPTDGVFWLWSFLLQFLPDNKNVETNGTLATPLSVRGIIGRLCTALFSRGRRQFDLPEAGHIPENKTESETVAVLDRDAGEEFNFTEDGENSDTLTAAEMDAGEELNFTEDGENSDTLTAAEMVATRDDNKDGHCTFNRFDIAENPLDHYFNGSPQSYGKRKWMKKVQQEWNILEKNLPDGICVRVFEDRMDLLRAVIVGACGTPYQDGLFFFDFHFPPEYPQIPPSTNYHSGGLRVNPNLYEDGKVCLSLLNTWTGSGNEVWDPSSSSILQVLVSIQGLVLNSKPYFNEPGYEMQIGTVGEKNALPYNENTYLLNLKSMLYLLRRPPIGFEGYVKDHFQRRGHYILKACEAYMEGCMIASLTEEACETEESSEHPCSVGFKLMLAKILPRLIIALSDVGVDCRQFEHLQDNERLTRRFESPPKICYDCGKHFSHVRT